MSLSEPFGGKHVHGAASLDLRFFDILIDFEQKSQNF